MKKAAIDDGAPNGFCRYIERHCDGHWKNYIGKVEAFTKDIQGRVFLDYGCKYGLITPIIMNAGAAKVVGVDVSSEYIECANKYFATKYAAKFVIGDKCYIDVESNSVDFVLANEVISHIHESFLDTFYREAARVLRPGGQLLISDGNNWGSLKTRLDLIDWYELWERSSSKEFGDHNYETSRLNYIMNSDIDLTESEANYIATNTSGLTAEQVLEVARTYKESGQITERPYQIGVYPTCPGGVLMERGFRPENVETCLETYGFSTRQILRGRTVSRAKYRGETKNFTILAERLEDDNASIKAQAITSIFADRTVFQSHSLWSNLETHEITAISTLRAAAAGVIGVLGRTRKAKEARTVVKECIERAALAGRVVAAAEMMSACDRALNRQQELSDLRHALKKEFSKLETPEHVSEAIDLVDLYGYCACLRISDKPSSKLKEDIVELERVSDEWTASRQYEHALVGWKTLLVLRPKKEKYAKRLLQVAGKISELREAGSFVAFMEGSESIPLPWKKFLAETALSNAKKLVADRDFLVAAENLILAHVYSEDIRVDSETLELCRDGLKRFGEIGKSADRPHLVRTVQRLDEQIGKLSTE